MKSPSGVTTGPRSTRAPRKSGLRLTCTHNRPGRSARLHTTADPPDGSPLCTPCVRTGREPAAEKAGAPPASPATPPAKPARSTFRREIKLMPDCYRPHMTPA
ncbi:hypothetical protein Abr02nite_82580 [Paractinoplanes brasiliensis]|nr:hypothetical protein Abr02nite_82580 [Actinoplanes brasiliensis]